MSPDWTPGSLRLLRRLAAQGYSLRQMAKRLDVTSKQVDLALWTLMGRTPGAAAIQLARAA
jgi:hypothetical protein